MLSQSDFCADSHAFAAFTYAFTNNDLNSVVTPKTRSVYVDQDYYCFEF